MGVTGIKFVDNLTVWNEDNAQNAEDEDEEATHNIPFCEKRPFGDPKASNLFSLDRPDAIHGGNP